MGRKKQQNIMPKRHEHRLRFVLILMFIFLAVISGAFSFSPLFILSMAVLSRQFVCLARDADPDAPPEGEEPLPSDRHPVIRGAAPETCRDYIYALYDLPLMHMPLGIYGHRAVKQLEQLGSKQMGLRAMLGSDHPFLNSAQDAESYILANCKKILWRLKYCDQGDPVLCRQHAEYMEERLAENEKVLRDFERLMIEVTQMDDHTPTLEPTLDVLADSLRTLRENSVPDQQQMMM